jgi:uncharacterized protein (TIGR02118 family)
MATVKCYSLLKKREDFDLEEFSKHWREIHAQIVRKTLQLTYYVQNHQIKMEISSLPQLGFDGVAEAVATDLETALAFTSSDAYREGLYKDEPNFLKEQPAVLLAHEHVIIPGPKIEQDTSVVKLMTFFHRKPGMPLEEFYDYWLNVHALLVHRTPGLIRYVQNHVLPETVNKLKPIFDGVAELWWPDMASFQNAMNSPELTKEQLKDSVNFTDVTTPKHMLCREIRII